MNGIIGNTVCNLVKNANDINCILNNLETNNITINIIENPLENYGLLEWKTISLI